MNMSEALLAATQNDHTEIVSCLLQNDFSLVAQIVELITSKHHCTELSLLPSVFEVMLHNMYEKLTTSPVAEKYIAHMVKGRQNSVYTVYPLTIYLNHRDELLRCTH